MSARITWIAAAIVVLSTVLTACTRCKSVEDDPQPTVVPPTPRELTSLEAIPKEVTAIVGLNIKRLHDSWLVKRAVEQMFYRDPELKDRIDSLTRRCDIDIQTGLSTIIIGLSGTLDDEHGREQAVMVVDGDFKEASLASCVGQSVAEDGRRLIADTGFGRMLYGVKKPTSVIPSKTPLVSPSKGEVASMSPGADAPASGSPASGSPSSGSPSSTTHMDATAAEASDEVWFTIAGPTILVVATSKEWLQRAVSDADKIMSSSSVSKLITRVDRTAAVWVAGDIDPHIGQGLVEQTRGEIAKPPISMFGTLSLDRGIRFELGVDMVSQNDANALKSLISGQLGMGALAAQAYGLGEWVDKLGVDVDQKTVYLRVTLQDDEIRQILSRIDTAAGSAQNPAVNSGEL